MSRVYIADSRSLEELVDESVHLVVTSPPYWQIKDYGMEGQVGHGQTLHEYLRDLYRVWNECFRVLRLGRRLCVNIGDQFARSSVYGRYKVIPLHAEVISQCEDIGFDFMGSIIWQKKTTVNTSGGATIMGSYPYPPNGMVEYDYEHILIFKKPGKDPAPDRKRKDASALKKSEWKKLFTGHWSFAGERQKGHEAMFPEELPKRLIKMFSFKGETVLDPFLGSGTTSKAALGLGRKAVGYEINQGFEETISKKVGPKKVEFLRREGRPRFAPTRYSPSIPDAKPLKEGGGKQAPSTFKVTRIIDERTLELENGSKIKLLGIKARDKPGSRQYLESRVKGKQVILKQQQKDEAYVYLKNRIFINQFMVRSGLARACKRTKHPLKEKFASLESKI